jgi:hypothetical protein
MDFNTEELLLIKILLSFGPKIEECHKKHLNISLTSINLFLI